LERQHIIFAIAAGAAFAALVALAYFNPFQQSEGTDKESPGVINVKKGQETFVRYSPSVVRMIQDLPDKNMVEVEVSSELQVTSLSGLRGEISYTDMEITYVRKGVVETIDKDEFESIEYRWSPDAGNTTKYVYENVDFVARSTDSQLVVTVTPLSMAKVGDEYTIKLVLRTGGIVSYQIDEKTIKIVS
jgi:hypothetical protein